MRKNLTASFVEQARLHPERIAVADEFAEITYSQLDAASDELARRLAALGLVRGDCVCVLVPRTKEVAIAAFAAWKAGCAYVPLDEAYPAERIEFVLEDTACAALVTMHDIWECKGVSFDRNRVLFLDDRARCGCALRSCPGENCDEKRRAEADGSFRSRVLSPDDPAIVFYTSGTTGRPKGVVHTCSSALSLMEWACDLSLNEHTRAAVFSNFSFIASSCFLFDPLLHGAYTFIVPDRLRTDLAAFDAEMKKRRIDFLYMPASLGSLYVETYDAKGMCIMLAGEKLRPLRRKSPCVIYNAYGATEGAPVAHCLVGDGDDDVPLGRPSQGVRVRIVDENLRDVACGRRGELLYRSPYMAKGYRNLPDQTAEKWIELDGERYCRTGDRVFQDDQGRLHYIGRIDDMVKVNGYRVELGEVEQQVERAFAAVGGNEAPTVACVVRRVEGADALCCFYASSVDWDIDGLRRGLSRVLPEYMIPLRWVKLEALPRNSNGKVLRSALKLPAEVSSQQVLTSLEAIRLASVAYRDYGVHVAFDELLAARSEDEVLALIGREREKTGGVQPPCAVDFAQPVEAAGLSFSQRGIWADCAKRPGTLMYNLPSVASVPPGVSLDELQRAVTKVVNAHPYLNTRFARDDISSIKQTRGSTLPCDTRWPVFELTADEFASWKTEAATPFNLDSDEPLYRIAIIRDDGNRLYLFTDFHHLIFDGTSYHVFYGDIAHALSGVDVPTEAYTYLHFCKDQRAFESSEEWQDEVRFWNSRAQLIDRMSSLRPDVDNESADPGFEQVVGAAVDGGLVRALAARHSCRPSVIYLASALLAVSAYTGRSDVGIATASSGRRNVASARSVGMFVNTLLVAMRIPSGTTADFIAEVQRTFLNAIAHENYPFSRIAADFGFSPGVMFAYQESLVEECEVVGQPMPFESLAHAAAKFPLFIEVTGSGEAMRIDVRYDDRSFSRAMMEFFLDTLVSMLGELERKDRLEQIAFCSPKQGDLLDAFNHVAYDMKDDTVVSLFRNAAQAYPDHTAVEFKGKKISYRDLDETTERLAAWIAQKVADADSRGADAVVSILVPRSEYMVLAPLAVLKAGCAYQPLDPSYPRERLTYMLQDARCALLIVDDALLDRCDGYAGEVALLSDLSEITEPESSCPAEDPTPESLFALLYTSGSTGVPKGVMLDHHNLVAFCTWYRDFYDLGPDCTVAAYASFGFDASMMDVYPALTAGACVCIVPEESRLDLDRLEDIFKASGATHSFMTTQIGLRFAERAERCALRCLTIGGEQLPPVNPPRHYRLFNAYGPTECTIFSTIMPVLKRERCTPIGRPLDTLACFVDDDSGRRLPLGAIGELVVCGAQVGRGYLNLPEQTAEAFFIRQGIRAYHTGDRVRYRVDGTLEFVGREDDQVKIRGFRIELHEVEGQIRRFTGVKDVAVAVCDDECGGKQMVAYVVADKPLDTQKIKDFVLEHKPSYMVPAAIVQLDELPLTVNQKVDKRALPRPDLRAGVEFIEPEGKTEALIAAAMESVLHVSRVGSQDAFDALGGDSVKAISLISLLHREGVVVDVGQILKLKTPRNLAKAAARETDSDKVNQEAWSGVVDSTPIVDYFFNLNLALPAHFNQAFLFEATHLIDIAALGQALAAVVRHHDMLRAVVRDGALWVRDVAQQNLYSLDEYVAANHLDIEKRAAAIQASIDLANGPLVKAAVFHDESVDYLLLVVHHAVIDGVSWRILIEDLDRAYLQSSEGAKVQLPSKTESYRSYAEALRRLREGGTLEQQQGYWNQTRKVLARYPRSAGALAPCPLKKTFVRFSKEQTNCLLHACSRAYAARPSDLLLAAAGLSYAQVTAESGLAVRLEGHGREPFPGSPRVDRTIGWFTSMYPVVLEGLDGDVAKVVRATKETLHRVPQNGFGYAQLYGIDIRDVALLTFNYLGTIGADASGVAFNMTQRIPIGDNMAPSNCYGTDLNLNCFVMDGAVACALDYNPQRFTAAQMQRFGDGIRDAIDEMAARRSSFEQPQGMAEDDGRLSSTDEDMYVYSSIPEAKPFVFVHTANTGSEAYFGLAQRVKDACSFSVFEQYNFLHPDNPATSVEELAGRYLLALKRHQPEGPYHLGGWCFGALVAFEMAQQLAAKGEVVDDLVLFDAHIVEDDDLRSGIMREALLTSRAYLSHDPLFARLRNAGMLDMLVANSRIATRSWLAYRPRTYEGNVTYFKATKIPQGCGSATEELYRRAKTLRAGGFEKYVRSDRLTVVDVPVVHDSLMSESALDVVAPAFRKLL